MEQQQAMLFQNYEDGQFDADMLAAVLGEALAGWLGRYEAWKAAKRKRARDEENASRPFGKQRME